MTKKRNAQDATRRHDVAPLRRRIERLELIARGLAAGLIEAEKRINALSRRKAGPRR